MATINDLIHNVQLFVPFKEIAPMLLDFVADVKGKLWTVEILTKNLNDIIQEFSESQTPTISSFFKGYLARLHGENTRKAQKYCFTLLMSLLMYKERMDYLKLYYEVFTTESDLEVYLFFNECRRSCLNIMQITEQKFTNLDGVYMTNKQWQIVINQCLNYSIEQIKDFEQDLQKELIRLKHEKVEKITKYCRSGEYSLNFFLRECLRRFSGLHQHAIQKRSQELEEYKRQIDEKLRSDYGIVINKMSRGRITKAFEPVGIEEDDMPIEDFKEQEKQRLIEEIKDMTCRTNQFKVSTVKLMSYLHEIDPFYDEIKRLINVIREALNQVKKDKLSGKAFEQISSQATPQMMILLERGPQLESKTSVDLKKLLIKTNPAFYKKLQQRETEFRPGVRKLIRELKEIIFSDRFSITMNRDAKNLEKLKDELEKLFNKFERLENSAYLILDTVFKNYDSGNRRDTAVENATSNIANKLDQMFETGINEKMMAHSGVIDENQNEEDEQAEENIIKDFETNMQRYNTLTKDLEQSELSKRLKNHLNSDVRPSLAHKDDSNDEDQPENAFEGNLDDHLLFGRPSGTEVKANVHSNLEEPKKQSLVNNNNLLGSLQKSEDEEKYVDRIQKEAADQYKKQLDDKNIGFNPTFNPRLQEIKVSRTNEDNPDLNRHSPNNQRQSAEKTYEPNAKSNRVADNPFFKKKSPVEQEDAYQPRADDEHLDGSFKQIRDNPFNRKSNRANLAKEDDTDDIENLLPADLRNSHGYDQANKDLLGDIFMKNNLDSENDEHIYREEQPKKPSFSTSPTFQNFQADQSKNQPSNIPKTLNDFGKHNNAEKLDNINLDHHHTETPEPHQFSLRNSKRAINESLSPQPLTQSGHLRGSLQPKLNHSLTHEVDTRNEPSPLKNSKVDKPTNEALANIELRSSNGFNFNPRLSGANQYNPRLSENQGNLAEPVLSNSLANELKNSKNNWDKNDSKKSDPNAPFFYEPKHYAEEPRFGKQLVTPAPHDNKQRSSKQLASSDKLNNLDDILNRAHRNSSDSKHQKSPDHSSPKNSRHHIPNLGDSQGDQLSPRNSQHYEKRESQKPVFVDSKTGSNGIFDSKRPSGQSPEGFGHLRNSINDDDKKQLRASKERYSNKSGNPFADLNSEGTFVDSKPYDQLGDSGQNRSLPNSQKYINDPNLINSLKDSFGRYSQADKLPSDVKSNGSNKLQSSIQANPQILSEEPTSDKKNLPLFASFGENRKSKASNASNHFNPEEPQRLSKGVIQERTSLAKTDLGSKQSIGKNSVGDSISRPSDLLLSSDNKNPANKASLPNSRILASSQVEEPNALLDLRNLDSVGDINRLMDDVQMPSNLNSLHRSMVQKINESLKQPEAKQSLPKYPEARDTLLSPVNIAPHELRNSEPFGIKLQDIRDSKPAPVKSSLASLNQSDVNVIQEPKNKVNLRNLDSIGGGDDLFAETKNSYMNSLSSRNISQNPNASTTQPQNKNSLHTTTTTNLENFDLFRQNLDKELESPIRIDTNRQPEVSMLKSDYKFSRPTESLKELNDKIDKIGEITNDDIFDDLQQHSPKTFDSQNSRNVFDSQNPINQSRNVNSSKYSNGEKKPLRSIKRPKGQAVARETGMSEQGDKSVKNYFKGFFGQRQE